MPLAKHNSTMDKVMGLISSLFDIASSQDVLFHQLQYVQCTHHGLAFVLLCVPVLFADNARCQFVIAQRGFPVLSPLFSIATGLIAEMLLVLFFVCNAV